MKCRDIERKILLADAGELPARGAAALDAHLASCPGCRDYKERLALVQDAALEALPVQEPSPGVVARTPVSRPSSLDRRRGGFRMRL